MGPNEDDLLRYLDRCLIFLLKKVLELVAEVLDQDVLDQKLSNIFFWSNNQRAQFNIIFTNCQNINIFSRKKKCSHIFILRFFHVEGRNT